MNNMNNTELIKRSLHKHYSRESRFRIYGQLAVLTGFAFLVILMLDIGIKAWSAFFLHSVKLDIEYSADALGVDSGTDNIYLVSGNFRKITRESIYALFPDIVKRKEKKRLAQLLSLEAEYQVKQKLLDNPSLLGTTTAVWVLLDDDADSYLKSRAKTARLSEQEVGWLNTLETQDRIDQRFNWPFFSEPVNHVNRKSPAFSAPPWVLFSQ